MHKNIDKKSIIFAYREATGKHKELREYEKNMENNISEIYNIFKEILDLNHERLNPLKDFLISHMKIKDNS